MMFRKFTPVANLCASVIIIILFWEHV